jgi:hypothetical protein
MFEPEYVEGIILDVLALEPGPATTDEVCARLRARLQHRFGEDDVSCYLSDMQKAGKTTITPDYRWKALVSPPSSARDTRTADPLVAPELVGGRRGLKPSAPSGRASSVQTSNSRRAEPAPLPRRETGPRWETFRRLCRYYGDCIREGEAPDLQVYPEREKRRGQVYSYLTFWNHKTQGQHRRRREKKGEGVKSTHISLSGTTRPKGNTAVQGPSMRTLLACGRGHGSGDWKVKYE